MITIKDVSYSIGAKTILADVSFNIGKKDRVGLVGANGAGKTTLFKLILGHLIPDKGKISFSHSISDIGYMPQTVSEMINQKGQSVFDFLLSGRPVEKIEKEMKELMESTSLFKNGSEQKECLKKLGKLQDEFEYWGGYEAENELLQIINGLQLDNIDLNAEISNLSGGEKSKVNFARVLYSKPSILLLDEPTNHLDKKSREWLSNFLVRYNGAVLIISHDATFLDFTVKKIVYLDDVSRNAEVFFCNYSQYLKIQRRNFESQERHKAVQDKKIRELKEFIDSMHNVSGKRKRQIKSREKTLKKLLDGKIDTRPKQKTMQLKISPVRNGHAVLLNAKNIHFGYDDEKEVIKNASFSIMRNERLVIAGENGSGKTTLLKIIAGILFPWKGELGVTGKTDIGYYAQEHEGITLTNTVIEELASVSDFTQNKLRSFLGRFMFYGDTVFQKVATLSPGERSRLALAKLSLSGANLLLLDEPTNHLDRNSSDSIAKAFREYEGSIVVVSHDYDFLENLGVERMLLLPQCEMKSYDHSIIKHFRSQDGR